MWDRLRDEGLCRGHCRGQASQAQFSQTGNQKGKQDQGLGCSAWKYLTFVLNRKYFFINLL